MYYSDLVKEAMLIAYNAHKEDMDKGGYPYLFHPFYLASQMMDEATVCVALLHDVIEDHPDKYSFKEFEAIFPNEIIDAVKLLTRNKEVDYMEYVKAIKLNPIATKVKIADIKHNMDVTRTKGKKPRKYDIYIEALKYLEG